MKEEERGVRGAEGAEEAIEDLEAPAAAQEDVAGGIVRCPNNTECHLPTNACSNPTCTGQTYCKPGTAQGCATPTCQVTAVWVQ
jgi:hypothetical protein